MSSNTSSKANVRKRIRHLLKQLTESEIAEGSRSIREQLNFPPASQVAIFAGLAIEPQLLELIEAHPEVNWYLPKVTAPGEMDFIQVTGINDLTIGAFGILEPQSGTIASHLDFIVCPGVAFTRDGNRLGQGGGFYDRAIPKFGEARILGVGFPCQIVAQLPVEEHDCLMDQIVQPKTDI